MGNRDTAHTEVTGRCSATPVQGPPTWPCVSMTTATRKKGGVHDVTGGNEKLAEPTLENASFHGINYSPCCRKRE